MTEIILNSGVKVFIPEQFEYAYCRGCKAKDIIWAKTTNGNNIPVRFDEAKGWICHFEDCPKAKDFRKNKNPFSNDFNIDSINKGDPIK